MQGDIRVWELTSRAAVLCIAAHSVKGNGPKRVGEEGYACTCANDS